MVSHEREPHSETPESRLEEEVTPEQARLLDELAEKLRNLSPDRLKAFQDHLDEEIARRSANTAKSIS